MLASESADTDAPDIVERFGHLLASHDPIEGLLLAFCDRERQRQKTMLDSQNQLRLLEVLATEFGGDFDRSDIVLAVDSVVDGIDPEEIARFVEHALLTSITGRGDRLKFRYPFVQDYLVARILRRWFLTGEDALGVVQALRLCASQSGSLLDMCADLLRSVMPEAWESVAAERKQLASRDPHTFSGFLQLVIRLSRDETNGSKSEAARCLVRILGNTQSSEFTDLTFVGAINGLDFSGVGFRNCLFVDAEFTSCVFDENTAFLGCKFEGRLSVDYCEGFGDVSVDESNVLSPSARSCLQIAQRDRRRIPVTEEQIQDTAREVLRRFRRGPGGFVTRKQDGVRRGTRRLTSFSDLLLDTLASTGVLRTYVSHGNPMYAIGDTHAVRVFLDNGLSVGNVKQTLEVLAKKLRD